MHILVLVDGLIFGPWLSRYIWTSMHEYCQVWGEGYDRIGMEIITFRAGPSECYGPRASRSSLTHLLRPSDFVS